MAVEPVVYCDVWYEERFGYTLANEMALHCYKREYPERANDIVLYQAHL